MQIDDLTPAWGDEDFLREAFGLTPEQVQQQHERARALLDAAREITPEASRADLPRSSQPPGQ